MIKHEHKHVQLCRSGEAKVKPSVTLQGEQGNWANNVQVEEFLCGFTQNTPNEMDGIVEGYLFVWCLLIETRRVGGGELVERVNILSKIQLNKIYQSLKTH